MKEVQKDDAYQTFTGNGPKNKKRKYVITEENAKIVDFAIKLGRPLLVEGEAGCGKTQLATAITDEFGFAEGPLVDTVHSTSRANDLLYRFDAIRRLQDSQMQTKASQERAAFAHNYVTLQPLGKAIFKGEPCVVLIDEIDKGDMDFPNDLLNVLDTFSFKIDEIPSSKKDSARAMQDLGHDSVVRGSGVRPIVVFTSNREQQLPKPFLRRCLYLELEFHSDPKRLEEIVVNNLMDRQSTDASGAYFGQISQQLVSSAVRSFLEIRDRAKTNRAFKLPATAELIDWVHVLHWENPPDSKIGSALPPYWKILFSTSRDIQVYHDAVRDFDPD